MADHLMLCGNKTDKCPNCGKYIRRAIFAYHYENNCADPDAPVIDRRARVTIKCEFCNENYDRTDSRTHRENCRLNYNNSNTQHSSARTHLRNDSDDDTLIPCEFCNQGIAWHLYENHTRICRNEFDKQRNDQLRPNMERPTTAVTNFVKCMFCKLKTTVKGLSYHERVCKMNSRRTGGP